MPYNFIHSLPFFGACNEIFLWSTANYLEAKFSLVKLIFVSLLGYVWCDAQRSESSLLQDLKP